jgi:TRAP-type C4-dicarboxylate transport system substrate-binding protein
MIKKLIILVILAGLGYVGYLVWNNLSESEKEEIKDSAGKVLDKGKEAAKKTADWATEKYRDSKKESKDEEEKTEEKSEESEEKKPPPVPKGPGKIVIPGQ